MNKGANVLGALAALQQVEAAKEKKDPTPYTVTIEGDELVVRFKIAANPELSESKKSYMIANTRGFRPIEGTPLSISASVTMPVKKKA